MQAALEIDALYLTAEAQLDDPAAWWRLGAALAERAHVREDRIAAIVALRHAASLDAVAADDDVLGLIAATFVELGEYDAAFHSLARCRIPTTSPQHYWRVARYLLEAERSADALALLRRVPALVERDDDLRLLRAVALADAQQVELALLEVDAIASARPDLVAALALKATLLGTQGRPADAIAAWQLVLRAQPGDADAVAGLGLVLAAAHRHADACAVLRQAVADHPWSAELHLHLAAALRGARHVADAERAARRAIELDSQTARGYRELARALDAADKPDDAAAALRDALLRERTAEISLALAAALERAGNPDDAQTALVEALAQARSDEDRAALTAAVDALRVRALSSAGMFAGSLAAFSVWQVLELAHHHRSAGRLELAFPDARVEVFVADGAILRVRSPQLSLADGPGAALRTLAAVVNRTDGSFAFRQQPVEATELSISIQHALMEIARVQDEANKD